MGSEMNDDSIPDDYISAAAAVVEAARKLDEARRRHDDAQKVMTDTFREQSVAENELREALENLKQADTGRGN